MPKMKTHKERKSVPPDGHRQGKAPPRRHKPLGYAKNAQQKRNLRGTGVVSDVWVKNLTIALNGHSY